MRLQNSNAGMGMAEMMVMLAVSGIAIAAFLTAFQMQQKQIKFIDQQADIQNFSRDLDHVFYSGVCDCLFDPDETTDNVNDAAILLNPGVANQTINIKHLRRGCAAGDPIVLEKDMRLPSGAIIGDLQLLNLNPDSTLGSFSGVMTINVSIPGGTVQRPIEKRMRFRTKQIGAGPLLTIDSCLGANFGRMTNVTLRAPQIEASPALYSRMWDLNLPVAGGGFENKYRHYVSFDDSIAPRNFTAHFTPAATLVGCPFGTTVGYHIRPFFAPYGANSACAINRLIVEDSFHEGGSTHLPTISCTGTIPPNIADAAERRIGFLVYVVSPSVPIPNNCRPEFNVGTLPELNVTPYSSFSTWEVD